LSELAKLSVDNDTVRESRFGRQQLSFHRRRRGGDFQARRDGRVGVVRHEDAHQHMEWKEDATEAKLRRRKGISSDILF
jgi:hypothetical protein